MFLYAAFAKGQAEVFQSLRGYYPFEELAHPDLSISFFFSRSVGQICPLIGSDLLGLLEDFLNWNVIVG